MLLLKLSGIHVSHRWPAADHHAVETLEIVLADGIELVIVAARAGDCKAEHRLADHVDLIVDPGDLLVSKMELLSGETQLHLSAPRFVSRIGNLEQREEKGVSFVAHSGTLSADGSKLSLNGDVVAFINGTSQQSTLTSNNLSYNSARMTVTTDGSFKLASPELTLSGTGLNADLDKEVFRINSKVRATHDAI